LLKKLQAAQNAAARLVTGTKKFDHITPVLRDLHWLPVRQRIKYKLEAGDDSLQVPTWIGSDVLG